MHEWELHLKGAVKNGVSKEEIQAILHQVTLYCGVPVGVECFRIARRVLAEIDDRGLQLAPQLARAES